MKNFKKGNFWYRYHIQAFGGTGNDGGDIALQVM